MAELSSAGFDIKTVILSSGSLWIPFAIALDFEFDSLSLVE